MKTIAIAFILAMTVVACGGYNTGTIQKTEKGFLKFTGNTKGIMISIDDGDRFEFDPKIDLYEVKPGKHSIKVYRTSQIIVDRVIIVDNQTIFELEVQ